MDYQVSKRDFDAYDGPRMNISISAATREEFKTIRKTLDLLMGVEVPSIPTAAGFVDLATFDRGRQDSLRVAAQLYYNDFGKNKILTIKHIRTLTRCDLRQGKELVEFACEDKLKPSWWNE